MRPTAPPVRPPRDLRLDIVRGRLQLSIFASHIGGSWIGSWLIHKAWGLSDSSEQFVFLAGFGLGSVFALKAAHGGAGAATMDLLRRLWRLYRTHLAVFFLFAALVQAIPMIPDYEPGDIGLTNDPYSGYLATHTPDLVIWNTLVHGSPGRVPSGRLA